MQNRFLRLQKSSLMFFDIWPFSLNITHNRNGRFEFWLHLHGINRAMLAVGIAALHRVKKPRMTLTAINCDNGWSLSIKNVLPKLWYIDNYTAMTSNTNRCSLLSQQLTFQAHDWKFPSACQASLSYLHPSISGSSKAVQPKCSMEIQTRCIYQAINIAQILVTQDDQQTGCMDKKVRVTIKKVIVIIKNVMVMIKKVIVTIKKVILTIKKVIVTIKKVIVIVTNKKAIVTIS